MKTQLEESVKCVYGQNIDARTYLHKFINVECRLPKDSTIISRFSEDAYEKYGKTLCELHGVPSFDSIIWKLARVFKLSLRDLQHCFTYLILFFSATAKNQYKDNRIKPNFAGIT